MEITSFIKRLDKNTTTLLELAHRCPPSILYTNQNNSWTTIEILEHVYITDKVIYSLISKPSKQLHQEEVIIGDEKLHKIMVEMRDRKVASPEILKPLGILYTLEKFETAYSEQLELLKQDLQVGKILIDNRIHKHPFLGEMTIGDWLNFMIHHTQRHLEQIKDRLKLIGDDKTIEKQFKNEALMEAISSFDVEAVNQLLLDGANPNFRMYEDKDESNGLIQPTTPLRMVLFRISDSLLVDDDLKKFGKIAKLLLNHGADPKPAIELAETRYGKFEPIPDMNPFWEVYQIVAAAK